MPVISPSSLLCSFFHCLEYSSYLCTGDVFAEEQNELIEASADMLFGLIHARYILTTKGLAAMVGDHLVLLFNIESQYLLICSKT